MQIIKFKRRREGKTNYKKRVRILLTNKPRIVIRKSLNNILIQLIEYYNKGDKIIISAHSNELKKIGWKFNKGNIPSAYLTGFLFGKKLKKLGEEEGRERNDFILDIGLNPSVKGSRIYAALKGMVDADLNIVHSKEIFPTDDRIKGKHISNEIGTEVEEFKKKIEK